MSLALAEAELKRFLQSPDPQVFCLSGKWGVGKTFAWNKVLANKQVVKHDDFTNYAYVSLFGIETLDRLRTSIFENAIPINPNHAQVTKAGKLLNEGWRKHVRRIQEIPKLKDFVPSIEPFLFGLVNRYVVCFDDLERMSDSLRIKDVLGLVSFLKEQRKCKVVIILNTDALDDKTADFQRHFEKVVDVNLAFDPTPEESAYAALPITTPATEMLKANAIKLGITNIRVIAKIERVARALELLLKGHDPGALRAAVHSATLLGWCIYEPHGAPPLDYIDKRARLAYSAKEEKQTPEENSWDKLLIKYGFGAMDELDGLILKGLRAGYFDDIQMASLAAQMDQRLTKERLREQFNRAWDEYHSSMRATRADFPEAMYAAAEAASAFITPMELDGTVGVLRSFGRPDLVTALLSHYVNVPGRSPEFFGLKGHFSQYVQDVELRAAFAAKHVLPQDAREIFDVLGNMVEISGWNPNDITRLLEFSEDQYYEALRECVRRDINAIIRFALDLSAHNEPEKLVGERMAAAVGRIGAEGDIEARRAQLFGIEPTSVPVAMGDAPA